MRIHKLHLTRYGKFTDFTLNFGEKREGESDFHIIYGLNEAGKSTTFTAWLDFLFGMGRENPYKFLHNYKTMKIGACIDIADKKIDLQRIKADKNSLLDKFDKPVNEMILLAHIAGLTRDSYKTMFSLDDESLEKGGDDILNSKGDLGEILFSATAGLDGINEKLAHIEKTANELYRKNTAKTEIQKLKKELNELKQKSNEIDVAASQYKRIVKDKHNAEENYNIKNQTYIDKNNEIDALKRQIELRKKLKNYIKLKQYLADFKDFPVPPSQWREDMAHLWQNDSSLQQQEKNQQHAIDILRAKIAKNSYDPKLTKLADSIKHIADIPKSRYCTAKDDINKRQNELNQKQAELNALIAQFHQPNKTANDLLIDKNKLLSLKALLEQQSLLNEKINIAKDELTAAKATLDKLNTGKSDTSPSPLLENETITLLEAKLNELHEQGLIVLKQNLEATLVTLKNQQQQAYNQLKPYHGSTADLASLIIANKDYWSEQQQTLKLLTEQLNYLQNEQTQIANNIAGFEAKIATLDNQTHFIDSATLKNLTIQKTKAWQHHYTTLNHDSANQFMLALQSYEEAIHARLNHFEKITQLEQAKIDLQQEQKKYTNQLAAINQKENEIATIEKFVETTLKKITITDKMPALAGILFIQNWLTKRQDYLAICEELKTHNVRLLAIETTIQQKIADIFSYLPKSYDQNDPKTILLIAKNFIEQQKILKQQHLDTKRAIENANATVRERKNQFDQLIEASHHWQQKWHESTHDLWLYNIDKSHNVRDYINKLEQLPELVQQCSNLEHRICAMQNDMKNFYEQVSSLYKAVQQPCPSLTIDNSLIFFNEIQAQIINALQKQQDEIQDNHELQQLQAQYWAIVENIKIHQNLLQQRFKYFETSNFKVHNLNELSNNLDIARELTAKQQELADIELEINDDYHCNDIDAILQNINMENGQSDLNELNRLQLALEPLLNDKQEAYALLEEKRKQLNAIGGDDKAAMIESQKQTKKLEIEELAITYLKLKSGLLLAHEALMQYRNEHRSSMLLRASKAFAEITAGNYTGLTTQLDGNKESLIALTRENASKLSSDLSKGTRFQLYLALRFAGYQEFALNHEAIPFIADDIMETFDEPRASEALKLMDIMSTSGQVIYLTHHRHICELAQTYVKNVKIHHLP